MSVIVFFNQEVSFRLKNKTLIVGWLMKVARKEKKRIEKLQYVFCNDKKILNINKRFLKHDYQTDIITFDYSQGINLQGEIYISLDTIQSNSNTFNVTFFEELTRVLLHGLLHLIGYKDKTKKEISLMRKKENEYLLLLYKSVSKKSKNN
jgi:probable rRNA maturation factor